MRKTATLLLLIMLLSPIIHAYVPHDHTSITAHARDKNDHEAMYSGGVPEMGDREGDLRESVVCEESEDGTQVACFTISGLGTSPDNRSYLEEDVGDYTVYPTNDGDPITGKPICHPQHKDTHEIGIMYFYDPDVVQSHGYGVPVASGPRGPPARDGCTRWHAQADANHIGGSVNMIGIDGTGRRAKVALIHHFTIEVPNPCYGKPCGNVFSGRYLHFEGKLIVFEIAPSRGQLVETWYLKQFTPAGKDRHLDGHTFGQNRVPLIAEWFVSDAGVRTLGITTSAVDNATFTWDTCGYKNVVRDPRWIGVPCVKSFVSAAKGLGGTGGRAYQNPNTTTIPQDKFGNRLLPISYNWVKCVEDQSDIVQPFTKDGDGAWLNPHQWNLDKPTRVIPYQSPECSYSGDHERMLYWPREGFVGVPNDTPAPEPTGVVPTSTPVKTQTPTPIRKPWPYDTVHYWNGVVSEDEPTIAVEHDTTLAVDHFYGDASPVEGIAADNWTAVYYGTIADTISVIYVRCDDVCRVVVNDVVEFEGSAFSTIPIPITHVVTDPIPVRVELVEFGGDAYVKVEYTP